MQIHLLGTAAGGGVPQWNCNCRVCHEARVGRRVRRRMQSSVAVSADGRRWFLLNTSPDIRAQMEQFPPFHSFGKKKRHSPIEAVLLTNADLDHTLGLLLLREGEKLSVHATRAVRRSLTEGISIGPAMESFCGLKWIEPADKMSPLRCRDGSPSGLLYETISLPGKPPRFARGKVPVAGLHAVGYRIVDKKTGSRLLFLPEVGALDEHLLRELENCDVLLFDGTFWSENEMRERGVGTLQAAEMGHMPISGAHGSLKFLAKLRNQKKIYTHINNTNPILIENSSARTAVARAGCVVGRDGMEFKI
jgi:pyrroloquinoline quinone biosynthesis protein B